jgi:hypothetical protein
MRRFIRLKASLRRETFTWTFLIQRLDRFEGSPRQQRPYTPEPYGSAASGVLRRMEGSLPHQAMAFGFAAKTRDPLARH